MEEIQAFGARFHRCKIQFLTRTGPIRLAQIESRPFTQSYFSPVGTGRTPFTKWAVSCCNGCYREILSSFNRVFRLR